MASLKYQKACLLAGLALGAVSGAFAAGLQVSPTGLSLPVKQRAGVFTLTNTGGKPLTAQVRVYRWRQDDKGKDVLTPSGDVVASPPMVKLAAGGSQQFRVIRTKPTGQHEEAFRLVVDELPAPEEKPAASLQFVLRYSIPLFLNQTDSPEANLQWRVERAPDGKAVLTVKNIGKAYAQLSNLSVKTGSKEQTLINGLAGYVLPGNTWKNTLDAAPASFKNGGLSATVNGRQIKPEVQGAVH
ncbi:fimbrial biogenesis chaperone [Neisseria wadsworthii]|uniref:fimbrial biogenesis chaperone n=1 Tax=Neisseria wadsworthii TaxID=607711 RepID=UPI000D31D68B|nr:molecular chaperone [Neisseria wadsworthii]